MYKVTYTYNSGAVVSVDYQPEGFGAFMGNVFALMATGNYASVTVTYTPDN